MQWGVAQKNLSLTQTRDLDIIVPHINEQQKFVSFVEKLDSLREKQNQSTQEINELFSSLMSKAFKGDLVRDIPEIAKSRQTSTKSLSYLVYES